jgi:hypothetical protein
MKAGNTYVHVWSRYFTTMCIGVAAALILTTVTGCGSGTPASPSATPLPTPSLTPTLVSPVNGGYVQQNDAATNCRYDPVYGYGFVVTFEWLAPTTIESVSAYDIELKNMNASVPLLAQQVYGGTRYTYVACNIVTDGDGWQWKVRARTSDGQATQWSAPYHLHFTGCRLANGLLCAEQPPE